jgi:putative oxidoreductase
MTVSIALTVAIRYLLVVLFFPFSALDKCLNFQGAVSQAREMIPGEAAARAVMFAGLFVEIVMPLAILTGYGDRIAAFVMAGYCGVTALLWKQFWKPGDFWQRGASRSRDLFWDFMKNFSLAGGFLLIALGTTAGGIHSLFLDPHISTHPYSAQDAQR